ncbi:4'-phosphopantetheinyl transferase family protein [Porphyromonas sp.]
MERRKRKASEEAAIGAMLRALLGEAQSFERAHDATGRPFLPELPERNMSLSHAEGCAALLLAPSSLRPGVDVETYRPQLYEVASRYLTEAEWEKGRRLAPQLTELELRTLLWSAKETAFKVFGPSDASLHNFVLKTLTPQEQTLCLRYPREETELVVHYELRPDYLFTFGWHGRLSDATPEH